MKGGIGHDLRLLETFWKYVGLKLFKELLSRRLIVKVCQNQFCVQEHP
jgi:hypothetical protein